GGAHGRRIWRWLSVDYHPDRQPDKDERISIGISHLGNYPRSSCLGMRISDAGPPERGCGWSRCAGGVVANNRRLYPDADAQDSGFLSALRHDDDGGYGGVDGNGSTRSDRKGL